MVTGASMVIDGDFLNVKYGERTIRHGFRHGLKKWD
jgi:hypothetical protein